jgi:hypothetical protein
MTYDIKTHLGQQMENFLNAFAGADVEGMLRIKETIIDIFKNCDEHENTVSTVESWDKEKIKEIQKILEAGKETGKQINDVKNIDEYFIMLENMRNIVTRQLGELEGEYWSRLRSYLLKNVDK